MATKRDFAILMFFALIVAIGFSINYNREGLSGITGAQQVIPVPSSATIMSYFAIASGGALASPGIVWSNIATLPAVDVAADSNEVDNPATPAIVETNTDYFISVSSDSNVNVDFCISADQALTSGIDTISLAGYEWDWGIAIDGINSPSLPGASMLTTYASAGTNFAPGSIDYYRFWLDVPSGQQAGTYTNTVNFKGVQSGIAC